MLKRIVVLCSGERDIHVRVVGFLGGQASHDGLLRVRLLLAGVGQRFVGGTLLLARVFFEKSLVVAEEGGKEGAGGGRGSVSRQ